MSKATRKIAADAFAPIAATRHLSDEPLTTGDWLRVWEAKKNFLAAIRQIVFEARCRAADETNPPGRPPDSMSARHPRLPAPNS